MMTKIGVRWAFTVSSLAGVVLAIAAFSGAEDEGHPFMRDVDLEALQEMVRWPNADVGTVLGLAGRFIAGRRDREAYAYFQERARSEPDRPLFLTLEGFFQAR